MITLRRQSKWSRYLSILNFLYQILIIFQANTLYTEPPCGRMHADTWDLSSTSLPEGIEPGTIDIVVMIFVLSALHPKEWRQAISNVYRVSDHQEESKQTLTFEQLLKPGGFILMRDYGRHDLTQLRFKEDRLLEDHFYVRGDGTRVYFFTLGEYQ